MFSKPVKKYKREQSWLFFVKGCFCLWVFMCVYMLRMETICSAKKALFLNVNWCTLIGFSQSMPNTVQAQCLRNSYAQLFDCIIFPEAILKGSIVKKVSYKQRCFCNFQNLCLALAASKIRTYITLHTS